MNTRTRLMLRAAVFALAMTLLASGATVVFLVSRGKEASPIPGPGSIAQAEPQTWTIEDARQFREFPLYWVGETFNGLPLTSVIRYNYEPPASSRALHPENIVLFIYGTCEVPPGGEGGCPPPLAIRVEPYCDMSPSLIAPGVKEEPESDIRGALAQQIGNNQLHLWTSNASISVFAYDTDLATEAANHLRPVSGDAQGPPLPDLGPPAPVGCPK